MPHFSSDQLDALALHFSTMASEVGKVRLDAISAGAKLDDPHIVDLQTSQWNLLTISSNIAVQAAQLDLSDADKAANAISVATQTADAALNELKEVDKAMNIASAAIDLGTAIYTGDLDQIAAACKTVIDASNAASAAPTP